MFLINTLGFKRNIFMRTTIVHNIEKILNYGNSHAMIVSACTD